MGQQGMMIKATEIHGLIYRDREQKYYLSIGLDDSLQDARGKLQQFTEAVLADLETEVKARKRARFSR